MGAGDPFSRPTATPEAVAPWLLELSRTATGLARSYGPGAVLDARLREQVVLAVTDVNGCRYSAWIHGSWRDFLGGADTARAEKGVLAYARACAEAGRPLDPGLVAADLPPGAVQALRATVAQTEVSNLVGNTVDGLVARLTRKRPLDPVPVMREVGTVAAALPVAVPALAAAVAMRLASRLAPSLPSVEAPPPGEANLLVDLLAQALPVWLANAAVRLVVLRLPGTLVVGVRSGRTAATIRLGRGRLVLQNGIADDAAVLVEGDVDPLLRLATGRILRQLPRVRMRPG
jgi:hypothetical protein